MSLADFMFSGTTNWETNVGFVISRFCVDATFDFSPKHVYQSIFVLTWMVAVFLLASGYQQNLKAIQSQPKVEKKIKTAQDLVNQNEIQWGIHEDGQFFNWGTSLPNESPFKTLAEKGRILKPDEKWYGACFTKETYKGNKYAAVCEELAVRDLLARDFSSAGKCNYYTTKDRFLVSSTILLVQVGQLN